MGPPKPSVAPWTRPVFEENLNVTRLAWPLRAPLSLEVSIRQASEPRSLTALAGVWLSLDLP